MDNENETEINEIEVNVISKKKQSKRWINGVYNNKPLDPEYFKKYYNSKLSEKVECPICKSMVGKQKLVIHQQRKKCKKCL